MIKKKKKVTRAIRNCIKKVDIKTCTKYATMYNKTPFQK